MTDMQALPGEAQITAESARESGNILFIVAARLARRECFTPLHFLSELPQRVVSMRALRDSLERSEEKLLREVGKIISGYDRMANKLKEAEANLEAAEKRIAELEASHTQVVHARDHYKRVASEGIQSIAESRTLTVKQPERYDIEMWPSPSPEGEWFARDDVLAALSDAGITLDTGE
jgi:hypothetical protein